MRRNLDETRELRRVFFRETRLPLWRQLVTLLVAAAFTVVMISLGLMRRQHFSDDSGISHQTRVQNGSQP